MSISKAILLYPTAGTDTKQWLLCDVTRLKKKRYLKGETSDHSMYATFVIIICDVTKCPLVYVGNCTYIANIVDK